MRARFVADVDSEQLLDPASALWAGSETARLELTGTPPGMQPAYVQATWLGRSIGTTDEVQVSALHDGARLAFRLEWEDASEDAALADDDRFADAAAILLPSTPEAPLITMGAPGAAVTAWYWRANDPGAREIVAEGIGSSRTVALDSLRAAGRWQRGRWSVVIARALASEAPGAVSRIRPGESIGFGVAVWEGGHAERAGLKSYSGPQWHGLSLDGLPVARS